MNKLLIKEIVGNNYKIKDFVFDIDRHKLFLQNEVAPRTSKYLKEMNDDWFEWHKFAGDMFKLKTVGAITNIEMRNYLDNYWNDRV